MSEKTIIENKSDNESYFQNSNNFFAIKRFHGYDIIEQMPATGGEADLFIVKKDNKRYILKLYRFGYIPNEDIIRQIKSVADLFPEDLIKIYDTGRDKDLNRYYLILEEAKEGNLKEFSKRNSLTEEIFVELVKQILAGLEKLHERRILHLDLKPQNILIRTIEPFDIVLSDFGISSMLDEEMTKKMTSIKGTEMYWSPEASAGVVSNESDFWSFGIIIYEILTGKNPFEDSEAKIRNYILRAEGIAIPENLPARYKLLLKGLLTRNPKKRWGHSEVNKWLNGEDNIKTYFIEDNSVNSSSNNFKYEGNEYSSFEELINKFTKSKEGWEKLKALFMRGNLSGWLISCNKHEEAMLLDDLRESDNDPNYSYGRFISKYNFTESYFYKGLEFNYRIIINLIENESIIDESNIIDIRKKINEHNYKKLFQDENFVLFLRGILEEKQLEFNLENLEFFNIIFDDYKLAKYFEIIFRDDKAIEHYVYSLENGKHSRKEIIDKIKEIILKYTDKKGDVKEYKKAYELYFKFSSRFKAYTVSELENIYSKFYEIANILELHNNFKESLKFLYIVEGNFKSKAMYKIGEYHINGIYI